MLVTFGRIIHKCNLHPNLPLPVIISVHLWGAWNTSVSKKNRQNGWKHKLLVVASENCLSLSFQNKNKRNCYENYSRGWRLSLLSTFPVKWFVLQNVSQHIVDYSIIELIKTNIGRLRCDFIEVLRPAISCIKFTTYHQLFHKFKKEEST